MEEDIKILESHINQLKEYEDEQKLVQALENLIKENKKLKKLKEKYNAKINELCELTNSLVQNRISKSKIEEKIEELEQENVKTYAQFLASDRSDEELSTKGKMLEGGIQALQELLKEK